MGKELEEYKYSNLELLREIWFNVPEDSQKTHQKHFDLILSKLNELQAIKEANPSEALKNLEYLKNLTKVKDVLNVPCWNESYEIVEKALLKAQEPKKYLKWEDLEFKHTPKTIDVKINGTKYTLDVGCNVHFDKLAILKNGEINYYFLEDDKQFFNDLHLERVEK